MPRAHVQCRPSVQFVHAAVEQLAYKVRRHGMWITPQQREYVKRFLTQSMEPEQNDWSIGYSDIGIILHREFPDGGNKFKTVTVWHKKPDAQVEMIALAPARQMWTATPKEEILATAGWLMLFETDSVAKPFITLFR